MTLTAELSYLKPEFQAFTVKTTEGGARDKASVATTQILGAGWKIENYGERATAFEILPEHGIRLTPAEAWDLTYQLRAQRGIVSAEPVFKAWIADRPDWGIDAQPEVGDGAETVSSRSGLAGQLCGPGPDLAEARDPEWSLGMTNVVTAWENHFSGPGAPGAGVVVGHPDTGYRRHPEIAQNLLISEGFDLFRDDPDPEDELDGTFPWQTPGHGTHTASVIVSPRGSTRQGSQAFVSGTAPGAKLIPFRVSDTVVVLDTLKLARAIERAADAGAHVISISMGGLGSERLHDAVIYAKNKGVIVLAAAGNCVGFVVAPAAYEEVVAVAACDARMGIWKGSSRGAAVDVTAPGDRVWNALANQDDTLAGVGQGSGTSYAVATVAGIAALWLAKHGRGTIIEACGGTEKVASAFMQLLRATASPMPQWPTGQFGGGLVDANRLLAAPLPDGKVAPSLAPIAEERAAVDHGGATTFAHLFESTLITQENVPGLAAGRLLNPYDRLGERLADLLNTSLDKLPVDLAQVGQELAFHLATDPSLHRQFANTMVPVVEPVAAGGVDPGLTSRQDATNKVRQRLLMKGVSHALATKLVARPLVPARTRSVDESASTGSDVPALTFPRRTEPSFDDASYSLAEQLKTASRSPLGAASPAEHVVFVDDGISRWAYGVADGTSGYLTIQLQVPDYISWDKHIHVDVMESDADWRNIRLIVTKGDHRTSGVMFAPFELGREGAIRLTGWRIGPLGPFWYVWTQMIHWPSNLGKTFVYYCDLPRDG